MTGANQHSVRVCSSHEEYQTEVLGISDQQYDRILVCFGGGDHSILIAREGVPWVTARDLRDHECPPD